MKDIINIQDLSFQYQEGSFSLEILELRVGRSEKLAVIGPSGSGKTTLLNLISGIFIPGSGTISVGGKHIHSMRDKQRRDFRVSNIGFIFQDFELLDYLSVLDNILHPYRITKALKLDTSVRERALDLAEQMGISDLLKRKPSRLSQGEKQRAAICRALLPGPKLILADEATGNLDPENKEKILDLMFRLVEKEEATLLAVTHDHELLPRFNRILDFKDFQAG